MARRKVIAYVMHEGEHGAATRALQDVVSDGAIVRGTIDDTDIAALEAEGIIVEVVDPDADGDLVGHRGGTSMAAGGPLTEFAPPPLGPDETTAFVVRVAEPLDDAMASAIEAAGATIVERRSTYTQVVRATGAVASDLTALAFVLEVERESLSAAEEGERGPSAPVTPATLVVDVVLDGTRPDADVAAELTASGAVVVDQARRRLRVQAPADHVLVTEPSRVAGVAIVSEADEATLHTDRARVLVGVDRAEAAAPPLTGAGQVVGVLDTGIDRAHPDLVDRIADARPGVAGGDVVDRVGHGTHVAGIVAGTGAASQGQFRGIAPGAMLFVQSAADARGALAALPVRLVDLLDEAYAAGVRIHNQSWGLRTTKSAYNADAWALDQFLWEHPDLLVVMSAGNEGVNGRSPITPDAVELYTVTAPATAKNVLTVGATRSDRTTGGWSTDAWSAHFPSAISSPPLAAEHISGDPDRIAAISSRGPSGGDKRVKPDVVAPGTDIVSCRSSEVDHPDQHFWALHANPAYAYLGGTSMAAPMVAGAAALVRQWLTDQGLAPSAALLRALLVNGTRWLASDDAGAGMPALPNYHQGFGMVHLPGTLPGLGDDVLRVEMADTWQTPGRQFTRAGQAHRWSIEVGDARALRVTMVYADHPGRGAQTDLNVYVERPDRTKALSNAGWPDQGTSPLDGQNTTEVIRIEQPVAGVYGVQVLCRELARPVRAQAYALVVSGDLRAPIQFSRAF